MQVFIGRALKLSFKKPGHAKGDISHFGALMTALAATIGTGNIVGVASAVALGGPGAVLWMWLTGVFGMATKFSEAVLSIKYRTKNRRGNYNAGRCTSLRKVCVSGGSASSSRLYAVAAFGIGNMVQANSAASLMKDTFSIPPWASGLAMTIFTAFVILGGIKSISAPASGWCRSWPSLCGGCLVFYA